MKYYEELRQIARNNRNNPTKGEELLWSLLRNDQMGVHFLRQKPIGQFILDFYSPKLLLDIEVDGNSHNEKENYDKGRDKKLAAYGIVTLRLRDEDVRKRLLTVREEIRIMVSERISLLSKGETAKPRGI